VGGHQQFGREKQRDKGTPINSLYRRFLEKNSEDIFDAKKKTQGKEASKRSERLFEKAQVANTPLRGEPRP